MTDTQEREIIIGNIRRLRELSTKGKMELCESIGMSRAYWDDVEAGRKDPSLSTLERIAEALEVTIRDLLDDPDKPKRRRA